MQNVGIAVKLDNLPEAIREAIARELFQTSKGSLLRRVSKRFERMAGTIREFLGS